jgi:hypothetical protein
MKYGKGSTGDTGDHCGRKADVLQTLVFFMMVNILRSRL